MGLSFWIKYLRKANFPVLINYWWKLTCLRFKLVSGLFKDGRKILWLIYNSIEFLSKFIGAECQYLTANFKH
jgi:hypothetical protein